MTAPLFVGTPGTVFETVFANLHRALIDDIQTGRSDEAYQRTVDLVRLRREMTPRPLLQQVWPLKGVILFVVLCLSWFIWRSDDRSVAHRVVTSAGVVVAGVDVGNDGIHSTRLVDREIAAAEAAGDRAGVRRPGDWRRRRIGTDSVSRLFRWLLS